MESARTTAPESSTGYSDDTKMKFPARRCAGAGRRPRLTVDAVAPDAEVVTAGSSPLWAASTGGRVCAIVSHSYMQSLARHSRARSRCVPVPSRVPCSGVALRGSEFGRASAEATAIAVYCQTVPLVPDSASSTSTPTARAVLGSRLWRSRARTCALRRRRATKSSTSLAHSLELDHAGGAHQPVDVEVADERARRKEVSGCVQVGPDVERRVDGGDAGLQARTARRVRP